MKKHEITGEAMRFVLVGVLATMLHYGLYLLMQGWMQVDVAYTLGTPSHKNKLSSAMCSK